MMPQPRLYCTQGQIQIVVVSKQLFDVTFTYHSTNYQTVRGVVAWVVPA